jgi:MinD-like ATPase involved in chromosome partitioning or flagellar assembly
VVFARSGHEVLLAGSDGGMSQFSELAREPKLVFSGLPLSGEAESAAKSCDVALIDAGFGETESSIQLHSPRQRTVLLVTGDTDGIGKGYGMIKVLRQRAAVGSVSVIVNQVTDGREAICAFAALRSVVSQFTDVQLDYLGHCERDEKILQSMMKRKILLDLYSRAPAIACLKQNMHGHGPGQRADEVMA